jgi:BirA family transcriptional regulator, biotin operon repressor / biotin---[acetyl-CoA-carboxylase] ligase
MPMDKLLLHYLNAGDVTGVEIAKHLGISRSAVWKRIEALRQQGMEISALPGKGYRLKTGIEFLHENHIKQALNDDARLCLGEMHLVDQIDSTNTWAQKTALADTVRADIFLAEQQLAGRGRRGRAWVSPYASNIYLSIHQRFDLSLSALSGLSLVVGMMIVKTLREFGFPDVGVKWPNDILAEQKKCGGILIEVQGDAQGPVIATIGIGLNVHMPKDAAKSIDQAWTDLQSLMPGKTVSRNVLLAALLNTLLPALKRFEHEGAAKVLSAWPQYDALFNKTVRVIDGGREHQGKILGVTEQGALRLLETDIEQQYHSGEISVRKL